MLNRIFGSGIPCNGEFVLNTLCEYAIEIDGINYTATVDDPSIDDDATPDIWKVDSTGFIVSVTDDIVE